MAAAVAGAGSPVAVPDVFARDAIIAWFRGEFAAANAIIDALCGHLVQIGGGDGSGEYDGVFAAIHRRRLNWIPVLHMQKYYSIADVYAELRRVAASRTAVPFPAAPKAQEVVPPGAATETEVEKEEKVAVLVAEEKEEEEEEAAESPTCVVDGAGVEETTEEDFSGDSSDQKTTEDGEANGGN